MAGATALTLTGFMSSVAAAKTTGVQRGGTLTFGLLGSPDSLNPNTWKDSQARDVFQQVYQPLVDHNANGTIVPVLATHWTVSPNKLVYTFYLRPGVKFTNGLAFTASVAKYSIEQANTATAVRTQPLLTNVKTITANNAAGTVTITLSRPDNILLDTLVDVMMIPPNVSGTSLQTHPIGTGPFVFVKWNQNQNVLLKANPHYWQKGLPYLSEINFTILSDPSTAVLQLQNGQIQALDPMPLQEVKQVQASPGVRIVQVPKARDPEPYFLLFNNADASLPVHNYLVREAINYALNRKQISEDLFGYFNVQSSVFPVGNAYHDPSALSYDTQNLSKARQLLTQAGYPHGFTITLEYFTISQDYITIAQVLQQSLGKIGITVQMKPVEIAQWIQDVFYAKKYDMALTSNTPKEQVYDLLYHQYGGAYQAPLGWNDPQWYNQLNSLRQITNPAEYKRVVNHLTEVVQQQLPAIIVGGKAIIMGESTKVHNLQPSPRDVYRMAFTWLSH